ncbi:hypothetical protein Mpt1_c08920 [Candidatus Methanoplasma termitum]|uniref:Uncharacterized protein n=2 Tax=Candidatus Methanoplasma termitum TaxID=1577791 RepID=A0A0A7LCP2_9ARCH|nr:hypothetical protein Mpt1_c08920 [Candidatus Methanoplasma termitum]
MYAAGIMAFAPTLILMYAVLRNYTYPKVEQPFFSDPRFFWLFVIGLIAGTFLFAFNAFLTGRTNMDQLTQLIYRMLFAVIQCLAMVAIINLKRFHGKSDTVFYGYGLGLGVGCTLAFGTIFISGSLISMGEDVGIPEYAWVVLIGLAYVLIVSAIGTTIGEGIARKRPMEFAMQAILIYAVFNIIIWAAFSADIIALYICLILALIVAAVYFYYIMHVKLSGVIRDVLRMEGNKRKDVPR